MKKYIAILLCMAVAAGVAACQPTPENPILVMQTLRINEGSLLRNHS